jgi:N-acetyl-anhydromuramyl-L-alanine amidase AmpD
MRYVFGKVLPLAVVLAICFGIFPKVLADALPPEGWAEPIMIDAEMPYPNHEARRTAHYGRLFVIHETAESLERTRAKVRSPRYEASFHVLLDRDGTIIRYVPAHRVAYTAGRSRFNPAVAQKSRGNPDFKPWSVLYHAGYDEAVPTLTTGGPSVNDFAFQVELVSPEDGYWCRQSGDPMECNPNPAGRKETHSGYTDAQYRSLAWLAVQTGVEPERITTHKEVELNARDPHRDPRSFDWNLFWGYYDGWRARISP